MGNRFVPALLVALLVLVHAQLWFGRGSIASVSALRRQLETQKAANLQAQQANERLASAPATLGYWSRWLPTRHFGPKPPQPVLDMVASGRPVDILASGSFPDGNFFVIQMTHGHPGDVEFDQGTSVKDLVGQQQAHLYGDAPFLLLFSDRHAADGSGWLVLLTRPGTTAATLRSPSGQTRQLPIRDGIALLRSDAGQLPDGVFSLYAGDKSPYYVGALH